MESSFADVTFKILKTTRTLLTIYNIWYILTQRVYFIELTIVLKFVEALAVWKNSLEKRQIFFIKRTTKKLYWSEKLQEYQWTALNGFARQRKLCAYYERWKITNLQYFIVGFQHNIWKLPNHSLMARGLPFQVCLFAWTVKYFLHQPLRLVRLILWIYRWHQFPRLVIILVSRNSNIRCSKRDEDYKMLHWI